PIPATPAEIVNAFELGYLAAIGRLRRQLPAAWRAGALAVLTQSNVSEETEDEPIRGKRFMPRVHGFKLVVMRCESAAAMLSWRKDLAPEQQDRLRHALKRLAEASAKLGVELESRPDSELAA